MLTVMQIVCTVNASIPPQQHYIERLHIALYDVHCIAGTASNGKWLDAARGRNFTGNDARCSGLRLIDIPRTRSPEVLRGAAANRSNTGATIGETSFI
jgi:hypothetical protein